jgi:hypothetical protein
VNARLGQTAEFCWAPLRYRARWALVIAVVIGALAHLPVVAEHLRDAPYMGEEFIVLIVACLLIAVACLVCDSVAVYALTVLTCGLAVVGYILTRLVAFPELGDDVGDWLEPLGVVSVLAESAAVGIAAAALAGRRAAHTETPMTAVNRSSRP